MGKQKPDGITWCDSGNINNRAGHLGISVEEYKVHYEAGERWCNRCKVWHAASEFGRDSTRPDGLASKCLKSCRVKVKRPRTNYKKFGWLKPVRNGDKKQARRRINYLVEQGRIPHPNTIACSDCGHIHAPGEDRHEYDHARGYDGDNQLYVEVVCSKCHHKREDSRNA